VDKHSVKVMEKHYLWKDPQEDLKLAKLLVALILGETVSWPSEEEAQAESQTLEQLLEDIIVDEDHDRFTHPHP
jgi:hypothetical protein